MENKEENYEEIPEVEIGKDVPPITAKRIVIEEIGLKEVISREGKKYGKKVILTCRHPDKKETISIDKVMYLKAKELKTSAFWYKVDDEGKIAKNSAFGFFMEFMKAKKPSELKGSQVDTVPDDEGYLVVKAY